MGSALNSLFAPSVDESWAISVCLNCIFKLQTTHFRYTLRRFDGLMCQLEDVFSNVVYLQINTSNNPLTIAQLLRLMLPCVHALWQQYFIYYMDNTIASLYICCRDCYRHILCRCQFSAIAQINRYISTTQHRNYLTIRQLICLYI